ncbi:hypothetical protein ES703_119857 [subsurface metagenome]
MFYYSKGMIRKNREAFEDIYGRNAKEFKEKMYKIYKHDKQLKKRKINNNSTETFQNLKGV